MVWTARELITESWYLSGIVSPQAQTTTGFQIEQGLRLLNRVLDFKQVQTDLIPYFKYKEDVFTVASQEKYFIPNVSWIQSITFNFSEVRFPLTYLTNTQYFANARVNNIVSLPYSYTFIRVDGGIDLYIYFVPMDVWQLNIFCKEYLTDVELDTDLELSYDSSYIEYLRWYLAKYMCLEYNRPINPEMKMQLRELAAQLQYQSPPDGIVNKTSVLQKPASFGYGFVNLFDGWLP